MIYRARYVFPTIDRLIEHGEVLVQDGAVRAVGANLAQSHPDEDLHDFGDSALLPGFVNAHSHLDPTLNRNFRDGLNLWDWLEALAFHRETVPAYDVLLASAALGAAECACSGITCLGDSSISGAAAEALSAASLRGIVYREVFGQSARDRYSERFSRTLEQVSELQDRCSDLVRVGVSPHSAYTSNPELLRLCAETCAGLGMPVSMHLAETAAEAQYLLHGAGPIADFRRRLGYKPMACKLRPAQLMADVGLLRPGVCFAHCAHLLDDEISLIAHSGAAIAHCPRSNAFLGAGIAPLPRFLSAGAVVGLGTDSAASCMRLDFFEEMRWALGLHRARTEDAGVITAKDVLEMATAGGAQALGLADKIGTLEPGKRADMVAVDLSRMLPGEDIYLAILSRSPSEVVSVMVDGEEVAADGRAKGVDTAACRAKVHEFYERRKTD